VQTPLKTFQLPRFQIKSKNQLQTNEFSPKKSNGRQDQKYTNPKTDLQDRHAPGHPRSRFSHIQQLQVKFRSYPKLSGHVPSISARIATGKDKVQEHQQMDCGDLGQRANRANR